MKIYVDDIREAPKGWTLATTINQAIKLIEMYSDELTAISLDHDISYQVEVNGLSRPYPSPECFCSVARYLRDKPMPNKPTVVLHTANPDGAGTLKYILKDFNPTYIPFPPANRLESKE